MTLKEAVYKSLEELQKLTTHNEVSDYIIKNKFYDFANSKTPWATVSALLGDFIRNEDARVKRIKIGNSYSYYLTKNEDKIEYLKREFPNFELSDLTNKLKEIRTIENRLKNCNK